MVTLLTANMCVGMYDQPITLSKYLLFLASTDKITDNFTFIIGSVSVTGQPATPAEACAF